SNAYYRNARIWALLGDEKRLQEPWSRAFACYTKKKKLELGSLLSTLAELAQARNPTLYRLLRDDLECLVDWKIFRVTPADFDKLPTTPEERTKFVFHLVPEGERLLQLHELDKFNALKKAVVAAGYRTNDSLMVSCMVQLAGDA